MLALGGAVGAAATAAAASRGAARVELQQISLQSDAQGATLTLALSGPVAQHLFRLHDPERLVIDLPATVRRAGLPAPPAAGLVAALRSGVREGQALRLVLELRQPVQSRCQPAMTSTAYLLHIMLASRSDTTAATAAPVTPVTLATAVAPAAATPATRPAVSAAAAVLHAVRAARVPAERELIVAVDAGHGGDDPGASGEGGTHEKDVTLAIARALAARIDRQPGVHAVLTRDGDYFVKLTDRILRARDAHADMFVSIHADAVRDREVSGASVYILSERGASSEEARRLAEQQNAADLKGGISLADQSPDVRSVLIDLRQQAGIGQSVEAADRVLGALDRVGAVRKREVQQAAFVVLKSPDIPSMLVETAYISNPGEERKLRTPEEQQRLSAAIFDGIDSYFRKYPPAGSRYARQRAAGAQDGSELARSGS
jgi:N-acetylmuramoyl-L-alanine amidase